MTLWSPDTCGCKVRLDGNGEPVEHVHICERHIAKGHFAVLDENRKKNAVVNDIKAAAPHVEVSWKFERDGTLTIAHADDTKKADVDVVASIVAKHGGTRIEAKK